MRRLSSPAFALVAALVLMALWAFMASAGEKKEQAVAKATVAFEKAPAVGAKATCPVSRQEFTIDARTVRSEYKGKHYVFCCPSCKPKFDKDPEEYLSPDYKGGH